jgi:hypothetical protein
VVNEFGQTKKSASSKSPTEFDSLRPRESFHAISAAATKPALQSTSTPIGKPKVAPEFASTGGHDEFGP